MTENENNNPPPIDHGSPWDWLRSKLWFLKPMEGGKAVGSDGASLGPRVVNTPGKGVDKTPDVKTGASGGTQLDQDPFKDTV